MPTEKEVTRRELMKLALAGGGSVLLAGDRGYARVPSSFVNDPRSPQLTQFHDDALLTVPPQAEDVADRFDVDTPRYEDDLEIRCTDNTARFLTKSITRYQAIAAEPRKHRFHPDLPETDIWGFRPEPKPLNGWEFAFGPTFVETFGIVPLNPDGVGRIVRLTNKLPETHSGFGIPRLTMHLHGGHHPALADGFPTDLPDVPGFDKVIVHPDGQRDYYYPSLDPGEVDGQADPSERPSTLWYHDHILDFTGSNVYRGLAGLFLAFDFSETANYDGTNETVSEVDFPNALRLPSGIASGSDTAGNFDFPLAIQDKRFAADGSLVFDPFEHNGFLGDTVVVNGTIRPTLEVQRRKYRFRFLNGSNARIYAMYLTNALGYKFPMHMVATEGGLLSRPINNIDSFTFAPAERFEVVVDFGAPEFALQDEIFVENRMQQTDGRKPDGLVTRGDKILRFRLVGGEVTDDPSRIGRYNTTNGYVELRPFQKINDAELAAAVHRTFEFNRSHGAWTINGELAGQLERSVAQPRAGTGEIWHLVNKSGGWWHPIHIHSELGRVLSRNGKRPPLHERDGMGRKDTILLRGNETADVFLKFRDHLGPFVFHCHNIEHEDMAMMARFDVVRE